MTESELDELGFDEVQKRLARGDYVAKSDELTIVTRWLKRENKERELIAKCERASISAALDASRAASRSNIIAVLALVIAAISGRNEIISTAKEIYNFVGW